MRTLLLLLALAVSFRTLAEDRTRTEIPPGGVAAHFTFDRGDLNRNLDMIRDAGVGLVRDEYNWSHAEYERGKYRISDKFRAFLDAVKKRGLVPQVVLCYAHPLYDGRGYPVSPEAVEAYAKYAEFVLNNLPATPRLVEIWNEWDGGTGMPSEKGKGKIEDYVALLRAVYPRLKAADPDCIVLGGSFCSVGLLEKALELGMGKWCDAVALHTYNYEEVLSASAPEEWYRRMLRIAEMLKPWNKPIYISEMGWPSHIGKLGMSDDQQADRLARLFLLARTIPEIRNVTWYDFQDDGNASDSSEENFGIVRTDLTPKPAYFALADVMKFLRDAEFAGFVRRGEDGLWVLRYRIGGEDALVLWTELDDAKLQVVWKASGVKDLKLRHIGRDSFDRNWGFCDWTDNPKSGVQPGLFSVTVGNLPVVLRGKGLAGAEPDRVVRRPWDERRRARRDRLKLPSGGIVATPKNAPTLYYSRATGESYHPLGAKWEGPKDLSFRFHVEYDAGELNWRIEVTDDVMSQRYAGEETWNADGIQFALQTQPNSGDGDRTEFDLALVEGKPSLFLRSNRAGLPNGRSEAFPAEITREGNVTTYSFRIPARLLKLEKFAPGQMFTASFLVNDADADPTVRRGFMQWGGGIGTGRDCNQYQLVYLGGE